MRIIAHLDMDAFFAAVEERDRPRFAGTPIVVGADPADGHGRGVVSTASYKARDYGIHSAMPITKAWELSQIAKRQGKPEVVFLQPDFSKYEKSSAKIFEIIKRHVALVEPASIDEFYLDLSFVEDFSSAEEVAKKIKQEIKNEEKLTASVGIAPNKLVAKIASDMQKPDGLTLVDDAEAFLEPLSIRKIPGVGPKTEQVLLARNVRTVRDAKTFTEEELRDLFGKWGVDLYQKLRGIDDLPVVEDYELKSIGEQETFSIDTRDAEFILERLKKMSGDVIRRFGEEGFQSFRTVAITVRFADFETKSRAHTLPDDVSSPKTLEFEAMRLLLPFLDKRENPRGKAIRLIGVRVEKLQ